MAGDSKNPVLGTFVFDGSEFAEYAVDLPPGACQGMLTMREGFLEVCQELLAQQATWGAKAGIPQQDMTELATSNERIERIDAFLPALIKAVEVLTETRYLLDDRRQRIVLDSAQSVDRRAKRNPELLAKYEKTRQYRSAVALKALKTREKNAAEATSGAGTPTPPKTPKPSKKAPTPPPQTSATE